MEDPGSRATEQKAKGTCLMMAETSLVHAVPSSLKRRKNSRVSYSRHFYLCFLPRVEVGDDFRESPTNVRLNSA